MSGQTFGGVKTVTTAGTPVPLGPAYQRVVAIEIFPQKAKGVANTGKVYVGLSPTPRRPLSASDSNPTFSMTFDPNSNTTLADIYVDADNDGDGVTFEGTSM